MTAIAARPATAIPGPGGHPLLGMARALRAETLGTLQAGFVRYGDVVAYRIGPARGPRRLHRLVIALHHPDDVRRVFTDVEAFTRRTPVFGVLREMFGVNLVTAEGEDWRRQKRLLQPLFTRAAVERYAALFEQEAHGVVERLARERDCTIDGRQVTEGYALRVLGRMLFEDERGIDDDTIAALERLVPIVDRQLFARATQPLRVPLAWPTPCNRRFAETRDALRATIERVLARGRGTRPAACPRPGLVSGLRDARDPQSGQPLSDREVRDQALIFLLAGYTTTATALCATLHLLGRHPRVQDRVARGGAQLALATVQEGLRLHPPSYVLGRRTGAGGVEIAGYALPPDTDVLVSPWMTHRHPRIWSDPERFDPWRFVDADERPPYAWLPFGGGARSCIGRQVALLEAATFVRALLDRCRLESLDERMPMSQLNSSLLSRQVEIRCRRR